MTDKYTSPTPDQLRTQVEKDAAALDEAYRRLDADRGLVATIDGLIKRAERSNPSHVAALETMAREQLVFVAASEKAADAALRRLIDGIEKLPSGSTEILARLADRDIERLSEARKLGTIGTVQAVIERSAGAAVSEGKIRAPNLFQRKLIERGLSFPEWVATKKNMKLKENTAKAWVKRPGKGGRPVPRIWAERIAAEFDDPALAVSENWPNGIRG